MVKTIDTNAIYLKKYNMCYSIVRDTISELDPNVSTTEEMEVAFQTLPDLLKKLRCIWDEWNKYRI